MCGISGVRSFSPEDPIRADQITQLLLASEHRGRDACGIALQERETGKIAVYKDDDPAGRFVQTKKFDDFLEEHLSEKTSTAILHTRASTSSGFGDGGSPRFNKNNHPMWKGQVAIVHNGCISNHKWLFEQNKYERSCDTDSDILRAMLDDKGLSEEGVRLMNRCSGGAAIAAVSEKQPEILLLARSGSPLVVGVYRKQVVWGSERGIVHAGFREYTKVWGIWTRPLHVTAGFTPMPNNTAWLFDTTGMVAHWEFNTAGFSQGYEDRYKKKRAEIDKKISTTKKKVVAAPLNDKEVVMTNYPCRNGKCKNSYPNSGIDITREMARDLGRWYCTNCRTYLDGHGVEPLKEGEKHD